MSSHVATNGAIGTTNRPAKDDLLSTARKILHQTERLVEFLSKENLPLPDLSAQSPLPDFLPYDNVAMQNLRRETVTQLRYLNDVLMGPRKYLMEHVIFSNQNSMVWNVIYAYKIPQFVPLNETITFEDLSAACGLAQDKLTRILRYAMLNHIFDEPEPGRVGHSAVSKLLASEQINMDFLGHNMEDVFPGCARQVDALKLQAEGNALTDCGLSLAYDGGKTAFFEYLSADPARVKRFGGNMEFMGCPGSHGSVDSLLTGFDWRSLGTAKVVDIGGSLGHTAIDLVQHAPQLSAEVQDLPDVIVAAKARREVALHAGKVNFREASFFDPQPVKDADVYLFRFIFHDWDNAKAVEILKNVIPSMKTGSLLVINDFILQPTGHSDPYAAKVARAADMQMMVLFNARERSLADWQNLAEDAVSGALQLQYSRGFVVVFKKI